VLHLDDGVLRRLHDDPSGVLSAARVHLASCLQCRQRAAALAENAGATARAFGEDTTPPADLDAALASFHARGQEPVPMPGLRSNVIQPVSLAPRPRYTPALLAVAVTAAMVFVVFMSLSAMGINFLTIFEPQQFQPIGVSLRDRQAMRYLPPLEAYGTLRELARPQTVYVPNAQQASALARMPVRLPQVIPPGVTGAVRFAVSSPGVAMFTFSAAKARAAALAAHRPLPAMPPGLDGGTLQVSAGPVVLMTFGGQPLDSAARAQAARRTREERRADLPDLMIAQAPMPRVLSTGVSARQIEGYLLNMPGVPPGLAAQIVRIGDPETTLPIPVPIDRARAQPVIVQGVRGLAVGDNTGVGAGVIWERDGFIYGVAGSLTETDILAIANSLR
jgi:hypothetical protein